MTFRIHGVNDDQVFFEFYERNSTTKSEIMPTPQKFLTSPPTKVEHTTQNHHQKDGINVLTTIPVNSIQDSRGSIHSKTSISGHYEDDKRALEDR